MYKPIFIFVPGSFSQGQLPLIYGAHARLVLFRELLQQWQEGYAGDDDSGGIQTLANRENLLKNTSVQPHHLWKHTILLWLAKSNENEDFDFTFGFACLHGENISLWNIILSHKFCLRIFCSKQQGSNASTHQSKDKNKPFFPYKLVRKHWRRSCNLFCTCIYWDEAVGETWNDYSDLSEMDPLAFLPFVT